MTQFFAVLVARGAFRGLSGAQQRNALAGIGLLFGALVCFVAAGFAAAMGNWGGYAVAFLLASLGVLALRDFVTWWRPI